MVDETKTRYLTFDVGGTKIASGLVCLSEGCGGRRAVVEDMRTIPTEPQRGGADVLARLARLGWERLDECSRNGRPVAGIGIGAAGVVDSEWGMILSATDLIPGWSGQRVAEAFGEFCDLPLRMVGDVVAHGLGEAHFGAGRGYGLVLCVGVGTGIGGAIIDHGVPLAGAHNVAGHVGHMPHGLASGFHCSCGAVEGHIEAVASGSGLGALYVRLGGGEGAAGNRRIAADGAAVSALARSGDDVAVSTLQASAHALGECLAGACNLLDPAAVVLSGSVAHSGELWWQALRDGFADGALPLVRATPLLAGALGGDAPLIGAAVAVDSFRRSGADRRTSESNESRNE